MKKSQNQKLNLFLSYAHGDESHKDNFIKHIAPLQNLGLIEIWHDRHITTGNVLQTTINKNLEKADVVCLFVSAAFLASPACLKEKQVAFKMKKDSCIAIFPIILSDCGWFEDPEIPSLLVCPTDGKPIVKFNNEDEAWNDVYKKLKKLIEDINIIKNLKITDSFSSLLQDTELLTKAHSQKDRILLDEIFVYPDLDKYDNLGERKEESSKLLIDNITNYPKVLIAGENQSGKTTLCKKIFTKLREKNFVPVYLFDKDGQQFKGGLEANILEAYTTQYDSGISIESIDKERIVPIIDNFHLVKHKKKYIEDLSQYKHQVITVDDIFSLNFDEENLTSEFIQFKIREFAPLLRNEVIRKWTNLTDKKGAVTGGVETYKDLDKITELVNLSLGIGIMPAYPFFIISIISAHETLKPLEQEITSQGYCYQALIYVYLRKQGAKNDEIEIYINFLTELAFYFYKEKKNELSVDEFNQFMEQYLDKYNLPIEQEDLLDKLKNAQIIKLDSLGNYSFFYEYIYFFFTAKYLAEHLEDNKAIISSIISNLHKDENAYIAIFISHHSKNSGILDDITLNAMCLFDKHKPATLNKEELSFFDKQVNVIVNAALLTPNTTPEQERIKKLQKQKFEEEAAKKRKGEIIKDDKNDLEIELRRAIKTVEVMGRIIKNRAGSLEKARVEQIFTEALNIYLRMLTSFFEIIKNENGQKEIIEFISDRLNKFVEDKTKEKKAKGETVREFSKEDLEKNSHSIFWNLNFFFIYGLIDKIVNSLGSDKLIQIVDNVCNKENTPAHFLIKHGIFMWYNKNLQTDVIIKKIGQEDFSEIAKKVLRHMIVNHCSIHPVRFDEKQKISTKLDIPERKLIEQNKLK